jgi:alpha-L-rhamnosidase
MVSHNGAADASRIGCTASDARWIVHPGADTTGNQWLVFRKSLSIDRLPDNPVMADIATDSKYWLYINGKPAVIEGGLKRGPNPDDTYFDRVDIGPYLKAGENSIALLVWFFGRHGFSHYNSGLPGLHFSANAPGFSIHSDATWRVTRHPSFGNTDEPHPNFRLPESNILFDARADIPGWTDLSFDDSGWAGAKEMGRPPAEPWNRLVERPVPLWKDFGVKPYENQLELDLPQTFTEDTVIRARLPYNAQITPGFVINSPEGKKITIKTDNYFGGSAYNVRTEYITRHGHQEFETPGWMNGHLVHYHIPAGVEVHDLFYRETGYNSEFTGRFECDVDFYNELWIKSKRSLYINMRDTYMDCPDRERAQWWGDVTLQMEQTFYALDRQSDLLTRKGILELIGWQRQDSTIFSPVPAGNWDSELPMQMLASVGYYGFWNYFLHSADTATIREVYPGVRRYLHVWRTGDDGLVIARNVGWTWGDWGENRDMNLLFNLWYSLALKGFEKMALLFGEEPDARWARETNERLMTAFHGSFWNGKAYRSPGYEGETDDRAHALAVLSGAAPVDIYPAIRRVLLTEYHASPYMEKYVLESLIHMGYVEDALNRMRERYRPQVESELTTLWEGWGIGTEGFGGGTYNHGWSGGPLTMLSRYIAGLAPGSPGFSTVLFKPHPGLLRSAMASTITRYGEVEVSFSRDQDSFRQEVRTPGEVRLVVAVPLPGKPVRSVSRNGEVIWQGGKTAELPGVTFLHEKDNYLYFEMAGGDYLFEAVREY